MVAYKTHAWMPIAARSFHQYFPEATLVIVDNNHAGDPKGDQETAFIQTLPFVTHIFPEPESDRSHGAGIDTAVRWCKEQDIRYLVHFEPDCLIRGRSWYESLAQALTPGIVMAGSHRKSYGPLHPTPSIWDLDFVEGSFRQQPRGSDSMHPDFLGVFDFASLMATCEQMYDASITAWFREYWDTGHKPWFQADIKKQCVFVPPSDDFIHFWKGSETEPPTSLQDLYDKRASALSSS
jgi:hypothetical protein